jgi:nucleoside-diphosphate-sugar epimerase
MQTILGAGGAIGNPLAEILPKYTDRIRLVSRNPQKVNDSDELYPADLLNKGQVHSAVKDSEVVYLTAGLPYKTKVWQEAWPVVIENVISACVEANAKLVFLDNMYMYDPDKLDGMTEETPVRPVSKKGRVRAEIAQMIMDAVESKRLNALIARAPDFYGPGISNSVLGETVFKNFKNGKKSNWFCSLDYIHSFIYTPDGAKAVAMLGNDNSAFNQVWHLPTATKPPTGKEWIEKVAEAMNVEPKVQMAGKTIVKIMGLFNPIMKEFAEMLYQWDRDYMFDSSKFNKQYNFTPTSWEEGIKQVIKSL